MATLTGTYTAVVNNGTASCKITIDGRVSEISSTRNGVRDTRTQFPVENAVVNAALDATSSGAMSGTITVTAS